MTDAVDAGGRYGVSNAGATHVIVEADGGSRGNPGPAGYGAVAFDSDHDIVLAERSGGIGLATNNVAEYRGLIAGLTAAAELGARVVDVRMDSKLVVEQMSGRWKIKHPDMVLLAREAAELVRQFDRVHFRWIPRAENAYADRLANGAMDAAAAAIPTTAAAATIPSTAAAVDRAVPVTESHPPRASPGWTGALGTPTRLLLLRHGQTELSVHRRYSGRGNPELTESGRSQAAAAAARLRAHGGIAAVVSSPLQRARQTAEVAARALGTNVSVIDGLTETDFGTWEGLTFAEAAARDPGLHLRWLGDTSVRPPSGESFDEVRARIADVRDQLMSSFGGETVLVVSHVTPIKTLLQLALGVGSSLLFRLHLDLASLSIAEFYPDGGSSVRLVNDTSHL